MKIDELPSLLARTRAADPSGWSALACAFASETEHDLHAPARLGVLLGLQYDLRPSDRTLVEYLFEQEILLARHSPSEHLPDRLHLVAVLATRFRDPSLAFLFLEAKRANFDTHCGFDSEFLLCGDAAKTWAWVQRSEHPERDAFVERAGGDGRPGHTQEELDQWWERKQRDYPSRWDDQPPLGQLELCMELGDEPAATRILERWIASPDEGMSRKGVLETARSWWVELGDADRAALAQEQLDEFLPHDPWDRASHLCKSAPIHARAGRLERGSEQLDALGAALDQHGDWQRFGLGLHAALTGADVADAAEAEPMLMRRAFEWTDALVGRGGRTSLELMERLTNIADRLGDAERRAHYEALALAERARLAGLR